ncbi:MAG TPA: hypothetical protein VKU41_14245 [Polyangiaceae bacterium]|nr:hypothetical protein [Polyangiaceae bacterium]
MAPGRRLRFLLLAVVTAGGAWAPPSPAQETNTASGMAARRHFDSARAHFGLGEYKEALTELEAAHALDPTAKDLVFNLGVVHDKLSHTDDALRWFRLYLTMDLTDKERERAEGYVHRLESAKPEPEPKHAEATTPETRAAPPPGPAATAPAVATAHGSAAPEADAPRPAPGPPGITTHADAGASTSWLTGGRTDTATLVAAGVTAGAFLFGVTLGVKAKVDQPGGDFVTGRDGSYADLASRADSAHREAVLADVGFATAIVGAALTAYLYFGRPRAAVPPQTSHTPRLGGAAGPGTGVLSLRGSF